MNANVWHSLFLVFALCAILILVIFANIPGHTLLIAEIQNTGHGAAFGAFSILLLLLLRKTIPDKSTRTSSNYLIAFGISTFAGIGTEIMQHFIGRDAEIADIVRDILGSLAFLGFYFSFDTRAHLASTISDKKLTKFLRVISMAVLLLTFAPLILCTTAYICRDAIFPTIYDFESHLTDQFMSLQDSELNLVVPPIGWENIKQSLVAQLILNKSSYPGFTILEPYPNWTGYISLCFDVFSANKDTSLMCLRIDDAHHNYDYTDRFNRKLLVAPGLNRYRISLSELRLAPATRETDMNAIQRIVIFGSNINRPLTVYFNKFWLE